MTQDCRKCKFLSIYYSPDKAETLRICSGDGWEEVEGGSYLLTEVSEFEPKDCLMFVEK